MNCFIVRLGSQSHPVKTPLRPSRHTCTPPPPPPRTHKYHFEIWPWFNVPKGQILLLCGSLPMRLPWQFPESIGRRVSVDILLVFEVLCPITVETRERSCMTIAVGSTGSTVVGKTPLRKENLCGDQMGSPRRLHSSVCWTCRALRAATRQLNMAHPEMLSF